MKSFFWKFLICLVPVVWASWMVGQAWTRYLNGEPGGFKLGVDLVGGTILVYEIDVRKLADKGKGEDADKSSSAPDDPSKSQSQKEEEDSRLLAEALKKRIDPNDLYNIIIRPAAGGRRVEIILPTGGVRQAEKADQAWHNLLEEVYQQYPRAKGVKVPRGRIRELVD